MTDPASPPPPPPPPPPPAPLGTGRSVALGCGGFLLFFAPPETHPAIRAKLGDLLEVSFRLDAPGSHVLHCGREQRPLAAPVRAREAA